MDTSGKADKATTGLELGTAVPIVFDYDAEPIFVLVDIDGDVVGSGVFLQVRDGFRNEVVGSRLSNGIRSLGDLDVQRGRRRSGIVHWTGARFGDPAPGARHHGVTTTQHRHAGAGLAVRAW